MDSRSFPSILVSLAALLLTGAAAQSPAPGDSYLDLLSQGTKLTAAEAQALEESLRTHPEDLGARGKLIAHYFVDQDREAWSRHVFWLIEHHPESPIAGFNFASVSAPPSLLNDEADYARAQDLWLEQTRRHPEDPRVRANAARVLSQPVGGAATARLTRPAGESGAPTISGVVLGSRPEPMLRPPTPPTPWDTRDRIRVGGNVQAANLIRRVEPIYPPLARQARIQGTVRFDATIGADGHVKNLQLISGHPLLVPAAQEAVRQWVYRPTLLNGIPVEVVTQIDVPFTLLRSRWGARVLR
jgi:TonB family protein